jgi:hypothetical protein
LGAASSTSVFHAAHDGQRPTHFGKIAPHAWQTNCVLALATAREP